MNEQAGARQSLNMDKLRGTFMNNMDIIKQVLASFKDSFVSFEEEFLDAQYQGDSELMSRLAHGLKGSAGNIRAEQLSSKAAALQNIVDQGQAPGALVDEVITDLARLLREIDAIVAGLAIE